MLKGDIKIETCKRISLKYSFSIVSSITTTFPSAGAYIRPGSASKYLIGNRKKKSKKI
jgi:hypothetical protein